MKQNVIALVGMPGAGKSEAAAYFKTKHIPIIRFGDQTDRGLEELGKEITPENERWYREMFRRELGMEAYAIKAYERMQKTCKDAPVVVFDGLYSWEEYVYLAKKIDHLMLLCIYAQPNIRYIRLEKRSVRPLSKDQAKKRDIAELESLNKGGPIALADFLIKNESTLPEFISQLESFYRHYQ
jgi:dephospho-CoA kinase